MGAYSTDKLWRWKVIRPFCGSTLFWTNITFTIVSLPYRGVEVWSDRLWDLKTRRFSPRAVTSSAGVGEKATTSRTKGGTWRLGIPWELWRSWPQWYGQTHKTGYVKDIGFILKVLSQIAGIYSCIDMWVWTWAPRTKNYYLSTYGCMYRPVKLTPQCMWSVRTSRYLLSTYIHR